MAGRCADTADTQQEPRFMARVIDGSVRAAEAADAAAIAAVHVASSLETYTGIIPDHVLASFTVDRRTATWRQILSDPATFHSSAVFVAEREEAIVGFGCCGIQRTDTLNAKGYGGEISSIYILRSSQGRGLGSALMAAMAQELRRRQLQALSLWVLRENISACCFYEALGGEIVGENEEIREHGILVEVAYGWRNLTELVERTASS
jgi:ribosomal protein S18 acetylase RimI-like enzyme